MPRAQTFEWIENEGTTTAGRIMGCSRAIEQAIGVIEASEVALQSTVESCSKEGDGAARVLLGTLPHEGAKA